MLELRILNGLQAGARLRLAGGSYLLGCGDECDVVMYGPGISALAFQLLIEGDQITAIPCQTGCGLLPAERLSEKFPLLRGQALRVGDVWLTVESEEAPWPRQDSWSRTSEMPADAANGHDDADTANESMPFPGAGGRKTRFGGWLAGAGLVTLVCGSALAYAFKPPMPNEASAQRRVQVAAVPAPPADEPGSARNRDTDPAQRLASPEAALQELHRQLVANDLADSLDAVREGGTILITGSLDAEQTPRFEAVLVPFVKVYGDTLSIHADVSTKEPRRLPFRIRQIVSGQMAHVVTDDGARIFEGGAYKGYRLAAFREHKLVFVGGQKETVELDW